MRFHVRNIPVEAAAKVLDLRTFSLPEGAEALGEQTLSTLSYGTSADPKAAYEFQKKGAASGHIYILKALKWSGRN